MAYKKPKSFTEKVQALFQPKITSPIPNAPVDNRSFLNKFQDFFLPSKTVDKVEKPAPTPTPTPTPTPLILPNVDEYLSSNIPASQRASTPLSQYYPAYQKVSDLAQKAEEDYQRPGFKALALRTGFGESTLGRSPNI